VDSSLIIAIQRKDLEDNDTIISFFLHGITGEVSIQVIKEARIDSRP